MPCLILIVAAMVLLPFSRTFWMFTLTAVLLGTGWAFLYPSLTTHVIERAGLARGPAMATFTALGDLGAGLGPMIMGFILEKTNYPVMFACLVLSGIINCLYFYHSVMKTGKNAPEGVDENIK